MLELTTRIGCFIKGTEKRIISELTGYQTKVRICTTHTATLTKRS